MSNQLLKLTLFSMIVSVLFCAGCDKEKQAIDRTPSVPQAMVEVKKDVEPTRTKLDFLTSQAIFEKVSEKYATSLGNGSQDELLQDLQKWAVAKEIDEGIFHLEVHSPSAPVGAALLRGWIDELKRSVAKAREFELQNRVIRKAGAQRVELDNELRSGFPELVCVEAAQPDLLIEPRLETKGSRCWINLKEVVEVANHEQRFNAVSGLEAINKFKQAKINGIQLKGSLLTLEEEITASVLTWQALDAQRVRKLNQQQIMQMQAALTMKINELGADAPEVVADRTRIKTLIEMTEINSVEQELPEIERNEAAYLKVKEFLDAEVLKYQNRLSRAEIAKGEGKLRDLMAIRAKLETAQEELAALKAQDDGDYIYDYQIDLVGKIRSCAAMQSDVEAYEKLRKQHEILPEIKFVVRNAN